MLHLDHPWQGMYTHGHAVAAVECLVLTVFTYHCMHDSFCRWCSSEYSQFSGSGDICAAVSWDVNDTYLPALHCIS